MSFTRSAAYLNNPYMIESMPNSLTDRILDVTDQLAVHVELTGKFPETIGAVGETETQRAIVRAGVQLYTQIATQRKKDAENANGSSPVSSS